MTETGKHENAGVDTAARLRPGPSGAGDIDRHTTPPPRGCKTVGAGYAAAPDSGAVRFEPGPLSHFAVKAGNSLAVVEGFQTACALNASVLGWRSTVTLRRDVP